MTLRERIRRLRFYCQPGAGPAVDALERAGDAIELQTASGPVGLLAAKRKGPADQGARAA